MERATHTGGQVDRFWRQPPRPILPSDLSTKGGRQRTEEWILDPCVRQGQLVSPHLYVLRVMNDLSVQGLDQQLESETGSEGGMPGLDDLSQQIEKRREGRQILLGYVVVAAAADHQGVEAPHLPERRRTLEQIVRHKAVNVELRLGGERPTLLLAHGIGRLSGLEK